jgi:pimeloyl-ACP methyl ester carboxylesterase
MSINSNVLRYFLALSAAALTTSACDEAKPEGMDEGSAPAGSADDPAADPVVLDPPTCDVEGLRALELPVDPGAPKGPSFTYYYEFRPGADPDGPIVIHIPGGPGGTSIGAELSAVGDRNLILTDPRGVGCNAHGAPHETDFYGTDRFASDVLAIVADLELQDYVLYGHSYGTVLATVVASRATSEGLPPPRLVVLEGIVGPAIENDDAAYRELWGRVRDALPEAVQSQLLAETPPLGFSRLQWGEFITAILSQTSPQTLFDLLMGLDEGQDPSDLRQTVDELTSGPHSWENEEVMSLFRPVACEEIAENSWFGFELVEGEVVPTVNACDAIDLVTPYDPADWPIDAPIVYVEGDRDPATTPQGAHAHFDAQPQTDRTFISVRGIGHVPLQWYAAAVCGDDLFAALLDERPIADALQACGIEATVEDGPAN